MSTTRLPSREQIANRKKLYPQNIASTVDTMAVSPSTPVFRT